MTALVRAPVKGSSAPPVKGLGGNARDARFARDRHWCLQVRASGLVGARSSCGARGYFGAWRSFACQRARHFDVNADCHKGLVSNARGVRGARDRQIAVRKFGLVGAGGLVRRARLMRRARDRAAGPVVSYGGLDLQLVVYY